MPIPKWLQRWSNATIKASIAENPAVATASGWTIDNNGEAKQNATEEPGVKQLQKALAVIGGTGAAIMAAPVVWPAVTNPAVLRTIDVVGSIDGARNLLTKNGVSKTINLAKNKQYGRAALSGLGDALDLFGVGDTARMAFKLGNKAYLGYHAFNTISPYSYDNMMERGKDWVKSMLLEKKYSAPAWKGGTTETDFLNEIERVLGDAPKGFAKLAREDAWAIYTGQTPKHGMYIKNADGTFSYNPEKIKEFYKDNDSFGELLQYTKQNKYDAIGVTHGGLWKAESTKTGSIGEGLNKHTFGNLRIEDMWDLNPFEREGYGLITGHINDALTKSIGTQAMRNKAQSFREWMYDKKHWGSYGEKDDMLGKLLKPLDKPLNVYRSGWRRKLVKSQPDYVPNYFTIGDDAAPNGYHFDDVPIPAISDKIIDAITDNKLTRKIESKIKHLEVGPILGGKPFYMATDIPYTAHIDINPEIKAFDARNVGTKIEFGRVIPEGYLDPGKIDTFNSYIKDTKFDKNFINSLTSEIKKTGGKIHIKKKNRGKFTDYCGGKVTEACIQRGKHSSNPTTRKRATFAANVRKWKHQLGGLVYNPINSKYTTQLTPAEEQSFRDWYKTYAAIHGLNQDPDNPLHYYDYRGYWKNGPEPMSFFFEEHLPDTWKTPRHPSHSEDSIYKDDLEDLINFTKSFETFRSTPYVLNGQTLIGYGSANPELIAKGRITEKEAAEEVKKKYNYLKKIAEKQVPNWTQLTRGTKYAILETMYNGGEQSILSKSPNLIRMLSTGITDGSELSKELDYSKNSGGWLGVRSSARRAMALGKYDWEHSEVDKYGRQIDSTQYKGRDDYKGSPYYNKYQQGGLFYTPFVIEPVDNVNSSTEPSRIDLQEQLFPIESVKTFNISNLEYKNPVQPSITKGQTQFKHENINVGNMRELLDKFEEAGISVRVTSGVENRKTKSGNISKHAVADAIDITPIAGETYADLQQKIKNSPELLDYMRENGIGIIDETNPLMKAKTGATGDHWHISRGNERLALYGFNKLFA